MREDRESIEHIEKKVAKRYLVNKRIIEKKAKEFLRSKKRFLLWEIDDETIALIKKGHKKLTLNIGFPFPIQSKERTNLLKIKGCKVSIFLRGESVRRWQRQQLFNAASKVLKISQRTMRKKVRKNFNRVHAAAYIDPYRFIGDGIIGLYFLETFKKHYKLKKVKVFSRSYPHLKEFYSSLPFNAVKNENIEHIIMPNLIDNQWEDALSIINAKKKAKIIMPGRNMYIEKAEQKVSVYWCGTKDILLRNKNIQEYMDDTLTPFLEKKHMVCGNIHNPQNVFYLNPFGSTMKKAMPVNFVAELCRALNKTYEARIIVVGGYYANKRHIAWIRRLRKSKTGKIMIRYYKDLEKLAKEMKRMKCSVVITADTSITHLANKLGYPNITVYHSAVWDVDSIQSMASDSPLGFCRYITTNLPLLITKNTRSEHKMKVMSMVRGIQYLKKSKKERVKEVNFLREKKAGSLKAYRKLSKKIPQEMQWMVDIYNPEYLVKRIKKKQKARHLMQTAVKISPLYKACLQARGKHNEI